MRAYRNSIYLEELSHEHTVKYCWLIAWPITRQSRPFAVEVLFAIRSSPSPKYGGSCGRQQNFLAPTLSWLGRGSEEAAFKQQRSM